MRIGLLTQGKATDTPAQAWLQDADHSVDRFHSLVELKTCLVRETFDLVLVDDALLGAKGAEQVSHLLSLPGGLVSLIVFNGSDDETRLSSVLYAGAEDFLLRDIGQQSFLARISAVLRRLHPALHRGEVDLICTPYRVDLNARRVFLRDALVPLTDKEFELALYLFRNPGRLLSRGHLLDTVWRRSGATDSRTIDTHISRLRNKLAFGTENGYRLIASYGTGYRLERLAPEPDEHLRAPSCHHTQLPALGAGASRARNWPIAAIRGHAASRRPGHMGE